MSPSSDRYQLKMYVGPTISVSPQEMEARHVARFHQLVDDEEIFADIKTSEGRRRHFHVISENGHLGPSKITTPHNFHISYLEVPPGMRAALHAHDAAEIFIPMSGRFALHFGDDGEHRVELDALDTVSVPPRLMRTFENIGNTNAILMVIYDGPGEVLGKIYVNEATAARMRQDKPELGRVNTNSKQGDYRGQSRTWRLPPSNSPRLSTACPGSVATSA